jgi:hypothetical protein
MNCSESDYKFDENCNGSTSSNGDFSEEEDEDDDEEINVDDMPLPKFQEKIENELLYG